MKKTFLAISALAAMLFAGCTSSDELTTLESIKTADSTPTPVQFGTYMGKVGTRAAGNAYEGAITNTQLQGTWDHDGDGGTAEISVGFGVFAHHNTSAYNSLTSRKPNFMYNEHIKYATDHWTYDNIKYWPNGQSTTTAADDESATSTSTNKVSFFAYAPHAEVFKFNSKEWTIDPTSGEFKNSTDTYSAATGAYGITKLSSNTAETNPKVYYTLNNDHFIDLLWGTTGTNGSDVASSTAQAGGVVNTDANGSTTSSATSRGNVNTDMTKQKVAGTVDFLFKHALAQVGGYSATPYAGLSVIADIDDNTDETVPSIKPSTAETGGKLDETKTKVTITSITITPDRTDTNTDGLYDNAMPTIGVLDLATGDWTNTAATSSTQLNFTQVINNNPSSGQYALNDAIKSPTTTFADWTWSTVSGITGVKDTEPTNVYASAAANPIILLPGTTPHFTITIQYEVCTHDTKLAKECTTVTQTITKNIAFGSAVELNKRYNILIHIGLTGVKFTASVSNWVEDHDGDSSIADDVVTVNLPINVQ